MEGGFMTVIKVTAESLHSVASQLKSGSGEVSQRLESMRSQVQNLVDSDWSGAASNSFQDLYREWNDGARKVKEALDGVAQMLDQAARIYQDTEDQLARQLRQ
jgi:WXG100 family type VII secretion target